MGAKKCFFRMGKVVALALCVAFCTLALGLTACSGGSSDSRVAATVMGKDITEGQVIDYIKEFRESIECTSDEDWAAYLVDNDATAADFRNYAIYELAGDVLIKALAEQQGLKVDDQTVNDEVAEMRKALGAEDDATWKSALSEYGLTEDELKRRFGDELLAEQVYKQSLEPTPITDDTVKAYIEESLSDTDTKHIRRIASADQATLEGLLEKINASSDKAAAFDELAQQADGTTYTAEVLGWDIDTDEAADASEDVEEIGVGQVTGIVEYDGGFEILLVDDSYTFPAEGQPANLGNLPASLREAINAMAEYDEWEAQCSEWLSEQIDAALEIKDMPEGLPYDVDLTAAKSAAESAASGEGAEGEEIDISDLEIVDEGDDADEGDDVDEGDEEIVIDADDEGDDEEEGE